MRNSSMALLWLLVFHAPIFGQELMPRQSFAGWFAQNPRAAIVEAPTSADGVACFRGPSALLSDAPPLTGRESMAPGCGLHWSRDCFPHGGCPDDYCGNPYPRQCWPPYPAFYRCVPAGDCAGYECGKSGQGRLTWWFIPTPRALRDALWLRP